MTNLQNELKTAGERFNFTYLDKGKDLLELSFENVVLIEAIIAHDSNYSKAGRKDAVPSGKYKGSTAYWMVELSKYLNSDSKDKKEFERLVTEAVAAVDRENSTHLNVGNGRDEETRRIIKFGEDRIIETLKNSSLELFDELVKPVNVSTKNGTYKRCNISFASKFCHYLCFWLFEGKPEADNYSIYDNIVKKQLSRYAEKYNIKYQEESLEDYSYYCTIINQILSKSGNKISRNGFDHLLWYYYKGRK